MDKITLWQTLTPLVIPIILMLVKVYILPRIPSALIPTLAPILGAASEILNQYTSGNEVGAGTTVVGVILGAAGVCVREILDQVKKINKA